MCKFTTKVTVYNVGGTRGSRYYKIILHNIIHVSNTSAARVFKIRNLRHAFITVPMYLSMEVYHDGYNDLIMRDITGQLFKTIVRVDPYGGP